MRRLEGYIISVVLVSPSTRTHKSVLYGVNALREVRFYREE